MTPATLDQWKCTPPPELEPPAPEPHDACEREIDACEREIEALAQQVHALRAALAATSGFRYLPAPRCQVCADGRPNGGCICQGTGMHYECAECEQEHVHGFCLELQLPERDGVLRFDTAKCMAAAIEAEFMAPRAVRAERASVSTLDDVSW